MANRAPVYADPVDVRSLLFAIVCAVASAGCGLVVDLDLPDPSPPSDAGAGADASLRDATIPDGAVHPADAAIVDAAILDASRPDAGDGVYVPSNIESRSFWTLGGGAVATREDGCYCSFLNTDTGEISGMLSGDRAPGRGLDPVSGIYFEVVPQASGPDLGVFVMEQLTVRSPFDFDGLYLYGDNALVLLVRGEVEIDGHLGDGSGSNGYRGGAARAPGAGPLGGLPSASLMEGGGGGGLAGSGGAGSGSVRGGAASGDETLVPLLHGSGGGGGYEGAGGRGGRGIQISSLLRIRASAQSLIDVRGSGGQSGGGGGGAGGAVLLEAPEVELAGRIVANGGGGGSCSARGSLGSSEVARAPGAEGCGGRGGAGGGADAVDGGDAIEGTEGAGGGGAAGRIRINATSGVFDSLRTSPLRTSEGVSFGRLP